MLNDVTESIEDYSFAIGLNPQNALVFVYRAKSKIRLRDYKGAIEDCNV